MNLKINDKDMLECEASDFQVLLHNPDYRENQYLDYKEDFAFLKVPKEKAQPKISEFRNDICSFANSEGGYILYGISDNQGTADYIYPNQHIFEPEKGLLSWAIDELSNPLGKYVDFDAWESIQELQVLVRAGWWKYKKEQ